MDKVLNEIYTSFCSDYEQLFCNKKLEEIDAISLTEFKTKYKELFNMFSYNVELTNSRLVLYGCSYQVYLKCCKLIDKVPNKH